jgi:hypothetical protein
MRVIQVLFQSKIFSYYGSDYSWNYNYEVALNLLLYNLDIYESLVFYSIIHKLTYKKNRCIIVQCAYTGIAAKLIVSILLYYDSTYHIAQAVEWIFNILLPNYFFAQSLQNLYINHEMLQACNELKSDLGTNFATYCILLAIGNQTNPCCKSKFD